MLKLLVGRIFEIGTYFGKRCCLFLDALNGPPRMEQLRGNELFNILKNGDSFDRFAHRELLTSVPLGVKRTLSPSPSKVKAAQFAVGVSAPNFSRRSIWLRLNAAASLLPSRRCV